MYLEFILAVIMQEKWIFVLFCGIRVTLSRVGTSATIWTNVPATDDKRILKLSAGMRIGRENGSTEGKPASVPLSLPQIAHDLTRDPIGAASVGSRQLTA
jgi:hypothetical protein